MAVQACDKQKLVEDFDDDDEPLVFKRSSSSSKQSQSISETKKSAPQKHDQQSGRQSSDVRPQNGQSNIVQRSKMVHSSKTPPDRSPLMSPKSSNSSTKGLAVKSTMVDSRPSTSMIDESKSVNRQIKGKNEPNEELEDSEDDKPLSARIFAGKPKVNSGNASKSAIASNLIQKSKIPKSEDSDDEIPLSSKFGLKSNAADAMYRSPTSGEKKPLLVERGQNGSASTERKPSTLLKKRNGDSVKPADESNLKKPKLLETSASHKSKEASLKAEMKEEEDDEDHIPISQRMKKTASSDKKSTPVKKMTKPSPVITKKFNKNSKKIMKNSKYSESSKVPPSSGEGQKWTTLVHNGVIFPPPYKPHGVKMLYKGKPVDLTPEQEEVLCLSLSV